MPDAIVLGGLPCVVLAFDLETPFPPLVQVGPLVVVAASPGSTPRGLEHAPVLLLRSFSDLLRLDGALRAFRPVHAVVHSLRNAEPLPVLAAAVLGARTFHLVDGPSSAFHVNARGAVLRVASQRLRRRLARVPAARELARAAGVRLDPAACWPRIEATVALADHAGATPARVEVAAPPRPLHVVHYIGGLGPGGAERQLTYLAGASRERGLRVTVLTAEPLVGDHAHYAGALRAAGCAARALAKRPRRLLLPASLVAGLPASVLPRVEQHMASEPLVPLVDELLREPPDVLHCWLDVANAVGGVAGLLAGVPRVVLSTRNLSPRHFPRLDAPWYRDTYHALARSPRLAIIANSRAGAEDYADWCDVPSERLTVVYNGFDVEACAPVGGAERERRRRALGLDAEAFLVVGLFRLDVEKRPLDFVAALSEAARAVPELQAVHVGTGPLEAAVRQRAAELGLGRRLVLAGRRADPWTFLALADACLLTSENEGCPNVALESQAHEVPIVLARGGGSPEVVEDEGTGFLCDVGDVGGFAARLVALAGQPSRRREMGRRGRALVAERFRLPAMVERTLDVYRGAGVTVPAAARIQRPS